MQGCCSYYLILSNTGVKVFFAKNREGAHLLPRINWMREKGGGGERGEEGVRRAPHFVLAYGPQRVNPALLAHTL